jgi:hypothetical protein
MRQLIEGVQRDPFGFDSCPADLYRVSVLVAGMRRQPTRSWEAGPMGGPSTITGHRVDLTAATANLPAQERKAVLVRLTEAEPDIAAFVMAAGRVFGKVQLSVDPATAAKVLP